MTDKREMLDLQAKARRAGRVANLCIDEGTIAGVFYLDANGPGRQKAGALLDPLSFAEIERAKAPWWRATP
jgi:hypothetical protein